MEIVKKPAGLRQRPIDRMPKIPRFEMRFALTTGLKLIRTWRKAKRNYLREVKDLPNEVKYASPVFWQEIEIQARKLGVDLLSYAPVEARFIFARDEASGYDVKHLYSGGIMLGMEMDFNAIQAAPARAAGLESTRIYAELGQATNKLAEFIQRRGYNAIACHPLGGPVLYPAMAVKAQMGEIGRNGLLITKQFGPRQRLSMISINASPLPQVAQHHSRITEFCNDCGTCIEACPVHAIYEHPLKNEDDTVSRINSSKCMPYFIENMGCSVCIKACPFHSKGYDKVA